MTEQRTTEEKLTILTQGMAFTLDLLAEANFMAAYDLRHAANNLKEKLYDEMGFPR